MIGRIKKKRIIMKMLSNPTSRFNGRVSIAVVTNGDSVMA